MAEDHNDAEDVLAGSPPTMHAVLINSFGQLPSPERCQSPNTSLEAAPPSGEDHTSALIAQYEARLAAKHNQLLQLKRRLQVYQWVIPHHLPTLIKQQPLVLLLLHTPRPAHGDAHWHLCTHPPTTYRPPPTPFCRCLMVGALVWKPMPIQPPTTQPPTTQPPSPHRPPQPPMHNCKQHWQSWTDWNTCLLRTRCEITGNAKVDGVDRMLHLLFSTHHVQQQPIHNYTNCGLKQGIKQQQQQQSGPKRACTSTSKNSAAGTYPAQRPACTRYTRPRAAAPPGPAACQSCEQWGGGACCTAKAPVAA